MDTLSLNNHYAPLASFDAPLRPQTGTPAINLAAEKSVNMGKWKLNQS